MSKTNYTSCDKLNIEQLDAVSGGAFPIVLAQMAILRACITGMENSMLDPEMPYRGPAVCEIPIGMWGKI